MFRIRGLRHDTILTLLKQSRRASSLAPRHVFLCLADHYEPMLGDAPLWIQQERVDRWLKEYPKNFAAVTDSIGRPPRHTFFYPAEEYRAEHLEKLASLCRQGFGEVEVHLHHDNDTSDNLRETLLKYKELIHREHGLLRKDEQGNIVYGFIHGNWALDNSRPDGRWCGVNDELTILKQTGCYADFTMPSAPSPTQTRQVNSIYYAVDDPSRPKSHDSGVEARVGTSPPAEGLLMIQGPLALDWGRRKWGLLPGLENSDLHGGYAPSLKRFKLWLNSGVSVLGRPDWVFIKLHTHGAKESNASVLLGPAMRQFHADLAEYAGRDPSFKYYYVTAGELARLVHQAESGLSEPRLDAGRA